MKSKVLLLSFIMLFLCSCKNTSRIKNEIETLMGRRIEFLDGYHVLSANETLDFCDNGKIKVVSYIEDVKCTECTIKMLNKWIECVNSMSSDVEYVIVLADVDTDIFDKQIKCLKKKCSVISYDTDAFKMHNNLNVLARNRTFLLNDKNEIVLVGEPFGNEKMKLLYSEAIRKYIN